MLKKQPEKAAEKKDMIFKLGDIVEICKTSRYFGSRDVNSSNPSYVLGTIRSIDGNSIRVDWANGKTNSYNPFDLEKVQEPNDKKIIMVLNYNKTTKTFPIENRIQKNLTEEMLDEIEKSAILTILQRYDKCLEQNETIIEYLYELLDKNITKIQTDIKVIKDLKEKVNSDDKKTKTAEKEREYDKEIKKKINYSAELKKILYKEDLEKEDEHVHAHSSDDDVPSAFNTFYSTKNIPISINGIFTNTDDVLYSDEEE